MRIGWSALLLKFSEFKKERLVSLLAKCNNVTWERLVSFVAKCSEFTWERLVSLWLLGKGRSALWLHIFS